MDLATATPSPPGTGPHDLESLVARTAGLQPWRRVLHAASGTLAWIALEVWHVPHATAVTLLATLLAGMIVLDAVRLRNPRANVAFFAAFRHVASPRESRAPASSTWYAAGILLSVAFFPVEAAVSGILVLAIADPLASYVGRRWGRTPFLGATMEGSAIFAAAAFGILVLRHDVAPAAVAALALALAERVFWPLDDNLTIPILGAAALTFLGAVP